MTSTRRFLFDTEFDADVARRREERLASEALKESPASSARTGRAAPAAGTGLQPADLLQAHEDGYADGSPTRVAAEAAATARLSATWSGWPTSLNISCRAPPTRRPASARA